MKTGAAAAPSLACADPPSSIRPVTAQVVDRVRHAIRLALAAPGTSEAADALAARAVAQAALDGDAGAPLRGLAQLFRLGAAELDVLQLCLAHAWAPRLGAALAQLNEHPAQAYPTPAAAARCFGHSIGRIWNPGGALAVWGLVIAQPGPPGEPLALQVDPVVPAWLEGAMWIDRALAGCVRTLEPTLQLPAWPLDELAQAARHALAHGRPLRFVLHGEAGAGRRACAAAAASLVGLRAMEIDTSTIADAEWPDQYLRLQRLAAVSGTALVWYGSNLQRAWPRVVAPAPLHFVVCETGEAPPAGPAMTQIEVEILQPDTATRRALWQRLVPAAAEWPQAALDDLAARYRLGAGDLLAIARDAPRTPEAGAELARACGRHDDDAVQRLACPYAWDELVLAEPVAAALSDFAYEAAERERVREQGAADSLLARESGVVALFAGPSGTGKTMAAQVIAARLQLDLLRVDLASVMSKYIGESAKNLRRVFALARRRQAVLLFDEADACFARRTEVKDAHDRYANADTNYLLQLLEAHRGTVILATNRRNDIDPAFVRRLRHVLEFCRPEAPQRLALWRQALRALACSGGLVDPACDAFVAALADEVDLSGAQVRNAALTALFAARRLERPIGVAHVMRGVERELTKDGRMLSPRWRDKWGRHA